MTNPIRALGRALPLATCAALVLAAGSVAAQSFPSRSITILNGFPPGGSTDITLRQVAVRLGERLGQSVVVENRAGASGTIAAAAVARAQPDGHTLLFGVAANLAVAPALVKNAPYDPPKAFTPIIEIAHGPYLWWVNHRVPANNMREFIAWAQKNAGKVNIGSPGQGSVHHLALELLKQSTKLDLTHIPYKGGGAMFTGFLGGEFDAMFESMPSPLPHMKAGKIRPLAVTGTRRLPMLPDVPTLAEQGVPDVNVEFWWGFAGPAGLPRDIVTKLNAEIRRALEDPATKSAFEGWNIELSPGTPEAFGERIARESAYWKAFSARTGMKFD